MPLSTATLYKLPDIETLRRLTKSIAMLDAIVCPDWNYRFYSYNSKWAPNEEMASMRNGSGDDWFLLFSPDGAALKGLAHEYPIAGDASFAARIQETLPAEFSSFLKEPAFSMETASFCIWRGTNDPCWNIVLPPSGRISPDEDGSTDLIGILDGNPETYQLFAVDYYQRGIHLPAIKAIYEHQALTTDFVKALNPECTISDVASDAGEICYPVLE